MAQKKNDFQTGFNSVKSGGGTRKTPKPYNAATGFAQHLEADPQGRIDQAIARDKAEVGRTQADFKQQTAAARDLAQTGRIGGQGPRRYGDDEAKYRAVRQYEDAEGAGLKRVRDSAYARDRVGKEAIGRRQQMDQEMLDANRRAGVPPPKPRKK